MIWSCQSCMDSFKLIKRPSKSLLTSRSSKSRETLETIPTPLDLLPPGFQKQGPPPPFGGPPCEILSLNLSFLNQIKIILQGSQILKNSSSFAVVTDTINIQSRNRKSNHDYQWQPDRQRCSDKRKLEGVGSHYEGKENVPVFRNTRVRSTSRKK